MFFIKNHIFFNNFNKKYKKKWKFYKKSYNIRKIKKYKKKWKFYKKSYNIRKNEKILENIRKNENYYIFFYFY